MVCRSNIKSFFNDLISFVETNIDEILNLPDLSCVPTAFLTEIQQDTVYETIYQELQKKLPQPHPSSFSPPLPAVAESDEQKFLSPHLLTIEGENEDDANDEVASSTSNDDSLSSLPDGYDTDIETGRISIFPIELISDLH